MPFFTPPRNRGGGIFSLQFVCVSVCVSVCPALLVNKIPAERMNRFGRDFRKMVASHTGSNPIEPTNFVLGTNTQQYNVHLIIQMKVTLTDDEGHMRRLK